MPDWISHVIVALIVCEVFSYKRRSLVVFGALLPDLLIKIELLGIVFAIPPNLFWLLMPLHTPIGAILTTTTITPLFKQDHKKTFYQLSIGLLSHFLFDLTNKRLFMEQLFPFFPFSWTNLNLGIIWPDEFWLYLIPLLIIYAVLKITKLRFSTFNK